MADKLDHPIQSSSPSHDWLERVTRFNLHFGRYLRDGLGVLFIAVAAITVFGMIGLTGGWLLTPWTDFLSLWFGWGTYLFLAALAFSGVGLIRRSGSPIRWGRLVALELAALLTLSLLALIGQMSLPRAELGMDGGRIGWSMAYLTTQRLGLFLGSAFLGGCWLLCLLTGFGAWAKAEAALHRLAGDVPAVEAAAPIATASPAPRVPKEEAPKSAPKKGSTQKIPPEFRTSLAPPEKKAAKATKPVEREEGLPPLNILMTEQSVRPDERTINQTAGMIQKTLAEFGIPATVIGYRMGPAVTQFAVQPGFIKKPGSSDDEDAQQMKVRVAQIANLQKDLALALSAERLRIEAPVPGKPYVGIEVPNANSTVVRLRPILESEEFQRTSAPLAIALGRDVSGHPLIADLARMPHLLIAGATGSGKSVCITALAACLAMNNAPEDLRIILIDAKMVELLRFNGLAHLYGKVETNIERILGVLRWVVLEMEHRYRLLEGARARDLEAYNRKQVRKADGIPLPRIVVLIDELADLMMSAPDQTEHNLVRLAQMARATGIHLVVATQRPSTDVVTGLIKANFPARLAFAVASSVDSRVILDTTGAETLLGRGDMLFLNPEQGTPVRAQGAMVTDMEIERILDYWQKNSQLTPESVPPWEKLLSEPDEDEDEGLIEQAVSLVKQSQRASASLLQRRLRIGYPRAARLLDQLEEMGVVGPSQGGGKEREVLVADDEQGDPDD
ncbi:MAG TPA: DNA translocase FtsK [Anaerolineales bacterium]|nr:DNA translocase FtsK [Anaerolineales bacterium]